MCIRDRTIDVKLLELPNNFIEAKAEVAVDATGVSAADIQLPDGYKLSTDYDLSLIHIFYRILCGYGSFFYPSTAVEDFSARYVYTLLIIVTAIIAILDVYKRQPEGWLSR